MLFLWVFTKIYAHVKHKFRTVLIHDTILIVINY